MNKYEAKSIRADKRADWVIGVFEDNVLINNFAVARKLNELHQENKSLKQELNKIKTPIVEDLKFINSKLCVYIKDEEAYYFIG